MYYYKYQRSDCDAENYPSVRYQTHYDVSDKHTNLSCEGFDIWYIVTSITAVVIGLAAIMSLSTFISIVLNNVLGDKYSDKTCFSIMK